MNKRDRLDFTSRDKIERQLARNKLYNEDLNEQMEQEELQDILKHEMFTKSKTIREMRGKNTRDNSSSKKLGLSSIRKQTCKMGIFDTTKVKDLASYPINDKINEHSKRLNHQNTFGTSKVSDRSNFLEMIEKLNFERTREKGNENFSTNLGKDKFKSLNKGKEQAIKSMYKRVSQGESIEKLVPDLEYFTRKYNGESNLDYKMFFEKWVFKKKK